MAAMDPQLLKVNPPFVFSCDLSKTKLGGDAAENEVTDQCQIVYTWPVFDCTGIGGMFECCNHTDCFIISRLERPSKRFSSSLADILAGGTRHEPLSDHTTLSTVCRETTVV